MNVLLKDGYVYAYAVVGQVSGGIDVQDFESEEELERFRQNPTAYKLAEDGRLELDVEKLAQLIDTKEVESLREMREEECFPVINRGMLWYASLTEAQKSELSAWYQAWLDVTETRTVPATPEWLI